MQILKYYFLLTIFALAVLLPGLASMPVIDRDSAHFAQATKQMLETGNYWQINFQTETRHLKPPGIYWLQAIAVETASKFTSAAAINKIWPYRLPSILGGLLSILLTFYFTRKFYSERVALLAALFLGSSLLLIIDAHLAVTDAFLLLTMIIMQGALWQIYVKAKNNQPISWTLILVFWLSMSAGILIKGITPLVGGLTLLGLMIADRSCALLRQTRFFLGLFVIIIFSLSWLIPLNRFTHSNFLWDMVHGDLMPKLTSGQESHGMLPGYYLIIFGFFFWSAALFIWRGYQWAWQQRRHATERFLLAWIFPTWIFFALIPTKLPEYVLPLYPAIAILVAKAIVDAKQLKWQKLFIALNRCQYVFWGIYGIILIGFFLVIPIYLTRTISLVAIFSSLIILATMILSFWSIAKNHLQQAALITIFGSMLAFFPVWQWLLPSVKTLWPSQTVMIQSQKLTDISAQNPLLSVGYNEPSLVFLTGTKQVDFVSADAALSAIKNKTGNLIIVDSTEKNEFLTKAEQQNISLKPISIVNGFDYSSGHWIRLNLYEHK